MDSARDPRSDARTAASLRLAELAEDHTRAERAVDWQRLASCPLDPSARAARAALWSSHARDEHRAMCLFTSLLTDLAALEQPLDVLAGASRLVRDELRHVELCRRVVAALGGAPPPLPYPEDPLTSTDRHARVAEAMLVGVYVAETASLRIISAARRREPEPPLRQVMQVILRDESAHSRYGAAWLQAYWPRWPHAARGHAASRLPLAFGRLQDGAPPWLATAVEQAALRVIVPQLEALGIEAGRAWSERRAV